MDTRHTRAAAAPRGLSWRGVAMGGVALAAAALGVAGLAGVSGDAPAGASTVVQVAAAENFWGSIAAQIGGSHAHVVSIITNPDTDPHAYEPTVSDARTLAQSALVVENGVGYDPWVGQLLAADDTHPIRLDVGTLLGVPVGANPHRWYDPADVQAVINQMVADYQKLDPADRGYFARQRATYEAVALRPYRSLVAAIGDEYSGTPVGASESIFALLAPALRLDLVTPPSFLAAISEGTEVTGADTETIDRQITEHRIEIYVYNSQNVTPDVQAQLRQVRAEHIPTATITETLSPASSTFQAWQTRQLRGIRAALQRALGARPELPATAP